MKTTRSLNINILGYVVGSTIVIYGIAYFWWHLSSALFFGHPPPEIEILTDVAVRYFLTCFLIAPTIILTGLSIILYSSTVVSKFKEIPISRNKKQFFIFTVICWIGSFLWFYYRVLDSGGWFKYHYRIWISVANMVLGRILFFFDAFTPFMLFLFLLVLLIGLIRYKDNDNRMESVSSNKGNIMMLRIIGWLWIIVSIGKTLRFVRELPYISLSFWGIYELGYHFIGPLALSFITGLSFIILSNLFKNPERKGDSDI